MGSLLDSTVVIAAERGRLNTRQLMRSIAEKIGEQPVVLSAIGYTEILKGVNFDRDILRRQRREKFFEELLGVVPVVPYTAATADIAGRIGGEQAAVGFTIPFTDLLIGATALELGYSILTGNVRHLRMIPGLDVIPF